MIMSVTYSNEKCVRGMWNVYPVNGYTVKFLIRGEINV